jgi:hypothetical protein
LDCFFWVYHCDEHSKEILLYYAGSPSMIACKPFPTPDPNVNQLMDTLLSGARAILGDRFVGLYIFGSLASGDFDPERSDIDFLIVTTNELPSTLLTDLQAMHVRITASGLQWATKLEGSYIPQYALRRYDPNYTQHPALRVDGSFGVDHHGSDWIILCHIIREHGIVVAGPDPQTLIDPVYPNGLRQATQMTLLGWWSQQLRNPVRLHHREYQAYAVLTMCRALYTLQHGIVVSKPVAARWAQETLDDARWTGLIERAIVWRRDDGLDDMNETLNFIRYTIDRSQQHKVLENEA